MALFLFSFICMMVPVGALHLFAQQRVLNQPIQDFLGGKDVQGFERDTSCCNSCVLIEGGRKSYLRFGEARLPGPFSIYNINPTQLYGHEEVLLGWDDGIITCSETSATKDAQCILGKRMKHHGMNTVWSLPVANHHSNAGTLRGKAAGCSIHSRLPLHPFPIEISHEVANTCRYVDALVKIGNDVHCYVATIYGPPHNDTFASPMDILNLISLAACERGVNFKGPAVITGDFNFPLFDMPAWQYLQRNGWVDAAEFTANKYSRELQNTSGNAVRKSFILINPFLLRGLVDCYVDETFDFHQHPILRADFDWDVVVKPVAVWSLPRSTDSELFDDALLLENATISCEKFRHGFHSALQSDDIELAADKFVLCWEETLQHSCVNTEGAKKQLPQACFGRHRKKLVQFKPAAAPIIPFARSGDYQPDCVQANVHIRRHSKQIRRVQSLHRQLQSYLQSRNEIAHVQCQTLWRCILDADGFPPHFQIWMLDHMGFFVPGDIPTVGFLEELEKALIAFVDEEVYDFSHRLRLVQKKKMDVDLAKGGPVAFASVRDPKLPPVTHLGKVVKATVKRTKWPKQGVKILKIQPCPERFDLSLPVTFQNQECMVLQQEAGYLVVDRPIKLRCNEMQIVQTQLTAVPEEMQQIAADGWNQFWQRPDLQDSDPLWESIHEKFHTLDDCPSCEYQPFDSCKWNTMLRRVSAKSARGACGFSVREFKFMPLPIVEWLFELFHHIEHFGVWPRRWTTARTVMLAKSNVGTIDGTALRPITILSRVYRLWARFRAAEALEHLGNIIPTEVSGVVGHVSSECLQALVADLLEQACEDRMGKCGLVIDLRKCFNLVPRKPSFELLAKAGIPLEVIRALKGMLVHLCRHIELGGGIGEKQLASCGIPEGCPFSIPIMACLSWFVTMCVQRRVVDVVTPCFADNWGIICNSVADLQISMDELEKCVHLLKMEIAPDKSWVWGTTSQIRRHLKHVQLCGMKPKLELNAVDMGCDMAYGQKIHKEIFKKRWAKAKGVLRRIQRKRLPKKFKQTMALTAGIGATTYGSCLHFVTTDDWKRIRGPFAASIGRCHGGANALLGLSCVGDISDPELLGAIRRCCFWRRFCKTFPHRQDTFLNRVASEVHVGRVGPAIAFQKTMLAIGWTCMQNGEMIHESGIALNWFYCAKQWLVHMMRWAWSFHVCKNMKERKGFDIDAFDVTAFRRSFIGREPFEQGILAAWASGKHATNDVLSKFNRNIQTDRCPLCGERDDKYHRVFVCKGVDALRKQHSTAINFAKSKQACWNFGILPLDIQPLFLKSSFAITFPELELPVKNHELVRIFTDGSCFFGDNHIYAFGGSAAILVTNGPRYKVVETSILPGIFHSAFRAEIYGVELALRNHWKVHLFIDCQAVVNDLNKILELIHCGASLPDFEHDEFWGRIVWHLSRRGIEDVLVTKVRSHQCWQSMPEGNERWCAMHSDTVDRWAKKVVQQKRHLFSQLERHYGEWMRRSQKLRSLHDFWCQMTKVFLAKTDKVAIQHQCSIDFNNWLVPASCHAFKLPLPVDVHERWPFGEIFFWRFFRWWCNLDWDPTSPLIAVTETYFHFCCSTGTMAPVLVGSNHKYQLRDLCVSADLACCDLGTQNRIWIKIIRWIVKYMPEMMPVSLRERGSGSEGLGVYGYSIPVLCISHRYRSSADAVVAKQLWEYFHTERGVVRSMQRTWRCHRVLQAGG